MPEASQAASFRQRSYLQACVDPPRPGRPAASHACIDVRTMWGRRKVSPLDQTPRLRWGCRFCPHPAAPTSAPIRRISPKASALAQASAPSSCHRHACRGGRLGSRAGRAGEPQPMRCSCGTSLLSPVNPGRNEQTRHRAYRSFIQWRSTWRVVTAPVPQCVG